MRGSVQPGRAASVAPVQPLSRPAAENRPFEKFATLIERHWDGIAAYCTLRKKVRWGLSKV